MMSNPVKNAIDSQSGRLEFLKQILTISSTGLGGAAYFFADSGRIPHELSQRVTLLLAVFFLALTVWYSLMGMATYSNLIRQLKREAENPFIETTPRSERLSSRHERAILHFARGTIVALGLAGVGLALFLGLRISGVASTNSPERAMNVARQLISNQTNHDINQIQVETFEAGSGQYRISVNVMPEHAIYNIKINTVNGMVEGIARGVP
jgi:hypothetical protein